MLGEIYKTLKEHQGAPLPNTEDEFDAKFGKDFGVKFGVKFGVNERKVLLLGDLHLVSVGVFCNNGPET